MSYTLYNLVYRLFQVYEVLIVVWCVLSWIPRTGSGLVEDIRGAIGTLVNPYLGLFRRFIPAFGGIDFSPVVAVFVLGVIERIVLSILI